MYDFDRSVNNLELAEKEIEPDTKLSGKHATRNIPLSNYDKEDYRYITFLRSEAQDLLNIPDKEGGFLTHGFGDDFYKEIDFISMASCGKDGFLRVALKTNKNINIEKQEQKRRSGLIGSFGKTKDVEDLRIYMYKNVE